MTRFHSTVLLLVGTLLFSFTCPCPAEEQDAVLFHRDPQSSLILSFPPAEGWSAEQLALAMLYAREAGASAVVVLHDGHLVLEWGRRRCAS